MALDTFGTVWNRVLLHCPMAGPSLAKSWVSHAFRRLAERRPWSWLIKKDQFLTATLYNTGTVTVTRGSPTVTGAATLWNTSALIGRQFRISNVTPFYTIDALDVGLQTLTLDEDYGGSSAAGVTYEIYQAFYPVPTDFHHFQTVWDPKMNWQLGTHLTQQEVNSIDAQRSMRGQAYYVVEHDYRSIAGAIPVPRYELWPHQISEYVYPYLYVSRATDLEDAGAFLPRFVRGDVLLEMALAEAARWPGLEDKPNPYFNVQLSTYHDNRAERMINELERQDDEVYVKDVSYAMATLPMAMYGSVDWLQRHSI